MRWRDILFKNLWWKLLAFALAVMIWSGAQNLDPSRPLAERTFPEVPVRVLSQPSVAGPVRLDPPTVQIDIEGDATVVRRLRPSDALVFVEFTGDSGAGPTSARVQVRLPVGIRLISVFPDRVVVRPDFGASPIQPEPPNPPASMSAPTSSHSIP